MALHQVKLEVDGQIYFEGEVEAIHLQSSTAHQPIVSNPMMGAVMAGASPEVWMDLPGEQEIGMISDSTTSVTFQIAHGTKIKMHERPRPTYG